MIYKRILIVLILIALIVAGSLALLKNKTVLSAQYKRCMQLTSEADQLFLNKKYKDAIEKYRQALMIDPKNQKLWQKLIESIRKEAYLQVSAAKPAMIPQVTKPETKPVQPQVVTPPAPSEPSFVIEEDEGC